MTDWLSAVTGSNLTDHLLLETPSLNHVPFRMTPNLQHFISSLGLEAHFLPGMMATARVLLGEFSTSTAFELENYLLLFLKDEFLLSSSVASATEPTLTLHAKLFQALDVVYQRFLAMAGHEERENLAADHLVTLATMPPGAPIPTSSSNSPTGTNMVDTSSQPQSPLLHFPVHQHLLNLLNAAVNPHNLGAMPSMWLSWF